MSESAEPTVLVSVEDGVGHLRLNRPRAINALDLDMIGRLRSALDAWERDDAVRVVLLDGAGERGLCAGGDVRGLREQIVDGRPDDTSAFFRAEYRLNARISEYPKPVVAIADGVTMGGGIGLAGHAAVRIVTERSRLAMPETRIGFTPDVGGSWLLGRAPGRVGEYLALTGATMDAADAVYAGFADAMVPADALAGFASSLRQPGGERADSADADRADAGRADAGGVDAGRADAGGVDAGRADAADADTAGAEIARVRALVAASAADPGPSALRAGRPWIDDAFAAEDVAGIIARLRARDEPEASASADVLDELSPTALTVTLSAVRAARALPDLRAALAQEYGLVLWFARTQPDLVEGIRAQLVDKDRAPKWQPATLDDVPAGLGARALAWQPAPALWSAP